MCSSFYLLDGLEAEGITVWVDTTGLKAGVDFLSKIGQAIIDAKVSQSLPVLHSLLFLIYWPLKRVSIVLQLFISLLSEKTIESKYCQDELALAYVSNKPIFPVGLKQPQELFPKMDTGM